VIDDTNEVLASIPGQYISRAAQTLPDAEIVPDEPHHVDIRFDGRHIRLTFRPSSTSGKKRRDGFRRARRPSFSNDGA